MLRDPVISFLCSIAATLLTPHVFADTSSFSHDMREAQLPGADPVYYCNPELIDVDTHKTRLNEVKQIVSEFCNVSDNGLPLPLENLLESNETLLSHTAPSDTDYPCTAHFDGKVLSIPCLKIEGRDPIYKADLSIISHDPIMLFYVKDVTKASVAELEKITKPAAIESIDVQVLESFPVQVKVLVKGYLRNSCEKLYTKIPRLIHVGENNAFKIQLNVSVTVGHDISCLTFITPFKRSLQLNVTGLKAGIYTVDVNGMVSSFELHVDNIFEW